MNTIYLSTVPYYSPSEEDFVRFDSVAISEVPTHNPGFKAGDLVFFEPEPGTTPLELLIQQKLNFPWGKTGTIQAVGIHAILKAFDIHTYLFKVRLSDGSIEYAPSDWFRLLKKEAA